MKELKKMTALVSLLVAGFSLFAYPYTASKNRVDVVDGSGNFIHRFEGEYAEAFAENYIESSPDQFPYIISLENALRENGLLVRESTYEENGKTIIPWTIQWDYVDLWQLAFMDNDYAAVEETLAKWESESPDNPELLIAYFNYYLHRDMNSVMALGQMDDGRFGLYDQQTFKDEDVKTGISYLDKALKNYPERLDIHFGKCSSLLRAGKYEEACKAIIDVLDTSKKVKNKWTWTYNEPIDEDGEVALFSGINDYFATLFNYFGVTKDYVKDVVTKIEKTYPNNIIGMNQCARYYSEIGDNNKAIKLLKKAYSKDKTDYVILGNLGYMYELTENYKEARKCYNEMLKMSDPRVQQYAQEALDAIKDK